MSSLGPRASPKIRKYESTRSRHHTDILLRYQRERGRHFHWEQPQRSNMFRTPLLQEVYCNTIASEFDMCNVGDLKDPENGKYIKKGMTVLTTSETLQRTLHGHRCTKDHDHQPLEGTTKYQGVRMSRTRYSEAYPKKFVRTVAKVLCQLNISQESPIQVSYPICTTEKDGPPGKKPRLSVSRSAAAPKARREFETPPPKRYRIWGKENRTEPTQNSSNQVSQWEQVKPSTTKGREEGD